VGAIMEALRAEGMAEGSRRDPTRLLERRFGPLPGNVTRRVADADPDRLDRWFDRALVRPGAGRRRPRGGVRGLNSPPPRRPTGFGPGTRACDDESVKSRRNGRRSAPVPEGWTQNWGWNRGWAHGMRFRWTHRDIGHMP